ncbi:MAG: sodium-translocating pyrophosphatase, partial [Clostridia bacterium]|nr:sodium-translocating pyrophosphatase [Clostridia bacterium]
MELFLILVLFAAVLAISYAAFSFFKVKKMDEGTDRMKEIAGAIRTGANAFLNYEMKIIAIVALAVAFLLALLISWQAGIAFVLGALMSESAGFIGMKIATYANVRVANKARNTKNLGETLKVAFRGGSVMGLCVGGFALLGIVIVYFVFGILGDQLGLIIGNSPDFELQNSLLSMFVPGYNMPTTFTMTLSGYALGCSVIAIFNRIGGGIYTKAADMGADLVGKTEAHIPEDDPRNPATIADNVGDNVGDVAGLGSDLLESYVSSILASVILAIELFTKKAFNNQGIEAAFGTNLIEKLAYFPIALAGVGLLACVLGVASLLIKKKLSDNPHKELNLATWISAGIAIIGAFGLSYFFFGDIVTKADDTLNAFKQIEFSAGWLSPAIAAVCGIASGIIVGIIAERYTSADYKHTKRVSAASVEGPALNITQGLALGMRSCIAPCVVLGIAIYASYMVCGMYGVALAALGMLSFVATTVSVDTYGPISDNAGGIAEMSGLDKDVRNITDHLDAVGNTTAAIGKGFAIGSAALAALSMMSSYLFAANPQPYDTFLADVVEKISLNIINPLTLAGAIAGAALPFLFSGMLIDAVAKAARKMVEEVRRQFREIKGLLQGEVLPDYKTCIEISSKGALKEMRIPAVMAIAVPVVCGFLFGSEFVAGLLIGSTLSAIMLAIFTGNAGGAWDNAKKYIETGAIEGHGKGSPAHDAAVVGDTVGDPLKDTVGPCLDIFIKIMSTISLVTVVVFGKYNLIEWI